MMALMSAMTVLATPKITARGNSAEGEEAGSGWLVLGVEGWRWLLQRERTYPLCDGLG